MSDSNHKGVCDAFLPGESFSCPDGGRRGREPFLLEAGSPEVFCGMSAEAGIDFTEDTKVVCEEFRLVYVPEKPITEKFDDNLKKGPGNGTEEEGI